MEEISFRAMGSEISCEVDSRRARVRERLERVPAMFEAWERILSRFRPDSELSQMNARTDHTVRVSETLWCVLQLARRAEQWSDGLVTPTILPQLEKAGYDRSFETLPANFASAENRLSNAVPKIAPPTWQVHDINQTLTRSPGTRLDLGGVAKGWAADQTAKYLGELGAALVDAGGDIVMTAPPEEGAWFIGIENPCGPETESSLPVLRLEEGAIATSGRDFRKWTRDGRAAHHLIDPRTNLPAETDVLTATIIAPTIFQAEVAAKVALLLGSCAAMAWMETHGDLAALLILEDGTVVRNLQMEKYIA